jgi:CRISPR system Cascade subunit CasC
MANRLYIDIHVLQTLPPSCVNRDDTGSPKTALFGGTVRARVSSQAWKKAVRDMFKNTSFETGLRTKRIMQVLANAITQRGGENIKDADKLAGDILKAAGLTLKPNKKTGEEETGALFFISKAQINALADLVISGEYSKEDAKRALKDKPSADIAMFGRMVADDADLNIDACVQVAHAISTHKVNNEFDYFTAIDETKRDVVSDAGAGMLGTVEFNSSTLYRYANICVHELANAMEENPHDAVIRFIDAFLRSMPTGKQNTFANVTPPYAAYITLRSDMPLNFAGAFESAVKPSGDGFEAESAKRLKDYADSVYDNWADKPICEFSIGGIDRGERVTLKALLEKLELVFTSVRDGFAADFFAEQGR